MSRKSNAPQRGVKLPATAPSGQETEPVETEVKPNAMRRTYTVAYKLKALETAVLQREKGTLGEWLRREGLYHATLTKWEAQREAGKLDPENPIKRGRVPDPETPVRHELERTQQKLRRAERELEQARQVIDIQKKLCLLFGLEPYRNEDER